MMNWDHSWGYTHGFGWVFILLFWLFILLGIIASVRWMFFSPKDRIDTPPSKTALDILDERFARGEIEQEEYEQRRRLLQK